MVRSGVAGGTVIYSRYRGWMWGLVLYIEVGPKLELSRPERFISAVYQEYGRVLIQDIGWAERLYYQIPLSLLNHQYILPIQSNPSTFILILLPLPARPSEVTPSTTSTFDDGSTVQQKLFVEDSPTGEVDPQAESRYCDHFMAYENQANSATRPYWDGNQRRGTTSSNHPPLQP